MSGYKEIRSADVGQIVYVTATGKSFYKGVIVDFTESRFCLRKIAYKVKVYRDEKYFFYDSFTKVFKQTKSEDNFYV